MEHVSIPLKCESFYYNMHCVIFVCLFHRGVVLYALVFGALPFQDREKIICGLVNYYDLPLKGRFSAGNHGSHYYLQI